VQRQLTNSYGDTVKVRITQKMIHAAKNTSKKISKEVELENKKLKKIIKFHMHVYYIKVNPCLVTTTQRLLHYTSLHRLVLSYQ